MPITPILDSECAKAFTLRRVLFNNYFKVYQ
jgi:hypothetical protein